MRSALMDELSDLDPARHVHAPGTPGDSALHEILGAERGLPRRTGRPGLVVATGAVAVTALAVGITWASVAGAPAAYASWTAVPTVADPAEVDGVDGVDGCPAVAVGDLPLDGGEIATIPVTPVVADVRGDYTYVLQAGDGAVAECFVSQFGGEPVVYSSSVAGVDIADVSPDAVEVVQNGTAAWSLGEAGEGAVTSAFGRAGADVRAVTVTLDDGRPVEASVDDGWWVVWVPGAQQGIGAAEVTLDDGTTTQVDLVATTATS